MRWVCFFVLFIFLMVGLYAGWNNWQNAALALLLLVALGWAVAKKKPTTPPKRNNDQRSYRRL